MEAPEYATGFAAQLAEVLERGASELAGATGNARAWAEEAVEGLVRAMGANRLDLYRASVLVAAAALERHGIRPRKAGAAGVAREIHAAAGAGCAAGTAGAAGEEEPQAVTAHGWGTIALFALGAGIAWGAGWALFYRATSRLVAELRAEVQAERASRDAMLAACLRAMADQRDDALRVLGDMADVIRRLADAVGRIAPEAPKPEGSTG